MGKYYVLLKKGQRVIGRDAREFSREKAQRRVRELNQKQKKENSYWVIEQR